MFKKLILVISALCWLVFAEKVERGTAPRAGLYYPQWAPYSGFLPSSIPKQTVSSLSFINYAFGNIYPRNGGYECGMAKGDDGDDYSDFQRQYSSIESVDGKPSQGTISQLLKLKSKYPNLKIVASIGGWTWSKYFSIASSTAKYRQQLVSSCVKYYVGLGFDGIDIDWEFPGGNGMDGNTVSPNDRQNHLLLMQLFRKTLDSTKPGMILTLASGAGPDKIDNLNVKGLMQVVNWINVMTYDYHGSWNPRGPTAHQSNLFPDPMDPWKNTLSYKYNTRDAIAYFIASGATPEKLIVGVPFYGQGWQGVKPGNGVYPGLYQPATGPLEATLYKDILKKPGVVYRHAPTMQSYKYDAKTGTFWAFDDPTTILNKIAWIKQQGLGGIFAWSAEGDDGSLGSQFGKLNGVVNVTLPTTVVVTVTTRIGSSTKSMMKATTTTTKPRVSVPAMVNDLDTESLNVIDDTLPQGNYGQAPPMYVPTRTKSVESTGIVVKTMESVKVDENVLDDARIKVSNDGEGLVRYG